MWHGNDENDRTGEGDEEEDENVNNIMTSTAGILNDETKMKEEERSLSLQGSSIERVRDVNQSVHDSGSGEIRVLGFHPKPDVPVLCVPTADRRVRLFNVSFIV